MTLFAESGILALTMPYLNLPHFNLAYDRAGQGAPVVYIHGRFASLASRLEAIPNASHSLIMRSSEVQQMLMEFMDPIKGIICEFNPQPGCFMVQELIPGALTGVTGKVFYAEEFQAVG